jgi:nicotinamidase-related amidase
MDKMIKIPNTNRKKALFIVDVQPEHINKERKIIVNNIMNVLRGIDYDLYVEAVFFAEKNSIWDKQQFRTFPKKSLKSVSEIEKFLKPINSIKILKDKKSIFKGNLDLLKELKKHKIEEIHLVGVDTNDCILASAYESFDLQFFTYVIEECCAHSESNPKLHKKALDLLRYEHMTNNSILEKTDFIKI